MTSKLKGFAFPMRFSPLGHIERAVGGDKRKSNIEHLLQTDIGERLARRRIGSAGNAQLLRPYTLSSRSLIESLTEEAVIRWIPDVIVKEVVTAEHPNDNGEVPVTIRFAERGSGAYEDLDLLIKE